MGKTDDKVIMMDSAAAATHRTNIEGWVSRHGNYFGGDERLARYDGCTHTPCTSCEDPIEKPRAVCSKCHDKRHVERYEAMPFKEWDGKTPLYSKDFYEYIFNGVDEFIDEQIANGGLDEDYDKQSLRLVICEPHYLGQIDEEHWIDDLPEDYDLPDDVVLALKEFNQVLKDAGTVSWFPGKYRTDVKASN